MFFVTSPLRSKSVWKTIKIYNNIIDHQLEQHDHHHKWVYVYIFFNDLNEMEIWKGKLFYGENRNVH